MNEYMKILGYKGRDRVTGFDGVVSSICFDLYGCIQVVLSPSVGEDGKIRDGAWFDAKRIEITSNQPVMDVPSHFSTAAGEERGAADKPAFSHQP